MYEETVRFFEDMFRNDGSILALLDADYTFLNEALAKTLRHWRSEWNGIGGEWKDVREKGTRRRSGHGDRSGQPIRGLADQPDSAWELGIRNAARTNVCLDHRPDVPDLPDDDTEWTDDPAID